MSDSVPRRIARGGPAPAVIHGVYRSGLYRGPVELADGRIVPGILFPREAAEGTHRDITGGRCA